ncbi:hypothetical protein KKD37_02295 [Patescibacteria group bacterium]|nr:hypothetical protein [Patescibacteria group bacterium]
MPETRERNKEIPTSAVESSVRMVDIGREANNKEPIPREIKTWMQKVEEDPSASLSTQISDDNGQPLITAASPVDPKVSLPITRSTFLSGLKKPFEEAGRWLTTFYLRYIKMKDGNVIFKTDDVPR